MPPILALIITAIFILVLLRLDRKQNPTASRALWIPTLWMLLVTSRALGSWTGTGGGMEEGSPLDRAVLSMLLIMGVLILISRNFSWTNIIKHNLSLMILIAFMLISVFWSEIPFLSLKRWIRAIGVMIIMACVVASEVDPRQALMSVFRRIIYVHMPLSILLIKYYPHLGVTFGRWTGEVMWVGVSTQKNGLAQTCYFAFFFFLWAFIRRWWGPDKSVTWYHTYIELFVAMLSLWLFMGPKHTLTYSSTSTATLAIGLAVLFSLLWLKRQNIKVRGYSLPVIISAIILYGIITPFMGRLAIFDVPTLLERSDTLTGRADIWAKVIPLAMEKPFLGHGFCFWTEELTLLTKANSSHNGYLDTIFGLGFIGLILSAVFLIVSCRKAQREMMHHFHLGIFWFCMVLMSAIHDIAESSVYSFTGLYPMVIFLHISSQSKDKH